MPLQMWALSNYDFFIITTMSVLLPHCYNTRATNAEATSAAGATNAELLINMTKEGLVTQVSLITS